MPKYKVTTEGGTYLVTTEDAPAAAKPQPSTAETAMRYSGLPKLGEAAKGFAKGAVSDTLGGLYQAVTSPIETVKALGRRHGELLNESVAAAKRGDVSSAIGYGIYGVIPGLGPAAEAAAGRIAEGKTLEEKAQGVGNLAALAFGPKATTGAAKAIRAKVAGGAEILKDSATKQYSRVLNATKQGNKARSAEVVPELLDRGVTAMTLKGLKNKAAAQVESVYQAIDDAWAGLPEGTALEVGDLANRITQKAMEQHTVNGVPIGPEAVLAIKNNKALANVLRDAAERRPVTDAAGNTSFIEVIPVEQLRTIRQYFDKVSAQAGRFEGRTLRDQSAAAAHAAAADMIRAELATQFPDIAKLNKEFNFWKKVDTVVGDTLARREGQAKPLGQKLAQAAGTAAGMTQGLPQAILGRYGMGLLEQAVTSPAWGTVSAVTKNKLANALARGDRATSEAILKQAIGSIRAGAASMGATAQRPALATAQPEQIPD